MSPDGQPASALKPRTKGERRAYTDGFADALLMVSDDGFEAARDWLATMAVADGIVTQDEIDAARKQPTPGGH